MTEKRLNRILAVVFLVVGVLASVNTIRLHTYIRETLPRDAQQEQCLRGTVDVLRFLLDVRIRRDEPLNDRDDTIVVVTNKLIVIVDRLVAGQMPTPEEMLTPEESTAWHDAVNVDNRIRAQAAIDIARHPIPNCAL